MKPSRPELNRRYLHFDAVHGGAFAHVRFHTRIERVHIETDFNKPLHQLIRECDLLLTDYSSIMYDFFYQSKPAIAYMFDRRRWEQQPPGPPHIDYERDLPLDVVEEEPAVLASIEWHMKNDFEMREEYLDRVGKFFKFRDQSNCERIYQSICRAIGSSVD